MLWTLLRFRKLPVAITADVEKMFRQIEVDPDHRQWQKILWRESPDEPVRTYALKTITYGLASSPFCAVRTLQQCAVDNAQVVVDPVRAAAASSIIHSAFYVDDLLTSAETPAEAVQLAKDVTMILEEGKMNLRKWNSNDISVISDITGRPLSAEEVVLGDSTTVFGLHWDAYKDELFYRISVPNGEHLPSKRIISSEIGKLFDPIGNLAPILVVAKSIMQCTWEHPGKDWDAPVSEELQKRWLTFRNALPQLERLRIPRWSGASRNSKSKLFGFGDASKSAYAAVIYLRSIDEQGQVTVALVMAKTRVAPSKKEISIPRLELCAAKLLVQTLQHVQQALHMEELEYELYSDSTVTLAWLQKAADTWDTFVANRVRFIQEHTNIAKWSHVRTEINPADCASRGLTPSQLIAHTLWWKGPAFIREVAEPPLEPPMISQKEEHDVVRETRTVRVLIGVTTAKWLETNTPGGAGMPLVERFSSLQRLLHTTAYVRRWRPGSAPLRATGTVLSAESLEALKFHLKETQWNHFRIEMTKLIAKESITPTSNLGPLNPFLDEDGLLRVGGRLTEADLPFDQQHPYLLPKKSHLGDLLVHAAHKTTVHGGIREMLQHLRQRFWILQGRGVVKAYRNRCVRCKLFAHKTATQQMASLPQVRVLVAPPFTNTGVDYCGPFLVRRRRARDRTYIKTYAAIFVCMSTKAVHIELAEDLSTNGFLDAFDRFVSRRGLCHSLYSDNGTQFIGANRTMQKDLKAWRKECVDQHIADAGVEWNFITPSAPHQGGLWEAAVKSAKKHLLKVVGKHKLHFYALLNLLTRIEACLNSRPLMAIHDDHGSGTALTPGDFLIGRPLRSRIGPCLLNIPENRLTYHQRLQQMYQHFWKRWQREYLAVLQVRAKWTSKEVNIEVGEIVAIKEDGTAPLQWLIGQVTHTHAGPDGLVRNVTIACVKGINAKTGAVERTTLTRPVQKLCRLL